MHITDKRYDPAYRHDRPYRSFEFFADRFEGKHIKIDGYDHTIKQPCKSSGSAGSLCELGKNRAFFQKKYKNPFQTLYKVKAMKYNMSILYHDKVIKQRRKDDEEVDRGGPGGHSGGMRSGGVCAAQRKMIG